MVVWHQPDLEPLTVYICITRCLSRRLQSVRGERKRTEFLSVRSRGRDTCYPIIERAWWRPTPSRLHSFATKDNSTHFVQWVHVCVSFSGTSVASNSISCVLPKHDCSSCGCGAFVLPKQNRLESSTTCSHVAGTTRYTKLHSTMHVLCWVEWQTRRQPAAHGCPDWLVWCCSLACFTSPIKREAPWSRNKIQIYILY